MAWDAAGERPILVTRTDWMGALHSAQQGFRRRDGLSLYHMWLTGQQYASFPQDKTEPRQARCICEWWAVVYIGGEDLEFDVDGKHIQLEPYPEVDGWFEQYLDNEGFLL